MYYYYTTPVRLGQLLSAQHVGHAVQVLSSSHLPEQVSHHAVLMPEAAVLTCGCCCRWRRRCGVQRELLKRSFDQLRRTQERLGRRERKLAKEQQKCRQYQQALTAWQASLAPVADAAQMQQQQQELFAAHQMAQMAMAAQAAAAAAAAQGTTVQQQQHHR